MSTAEIATAADELADSLASVAVVLQPRLVAYCARCSMPYEYCEYGPTPKECAADRPAAEDQAPESADSASAAGAANDTASSPAKGDKKAQKSSQKAPPQDTRIAIKRQQRNKRKFITSVQGLDAHQVDLKKAAKLFANKFACGASVSAVHINGRPAEEIVIQGDVMEQVARIIPQQWPHISTDSLQCTE